MWMVPRAASKEKAADGQNHAEIYISLNLAMYVGVNSTMGVFVCQTKKTFNLLYSISSISYISRREDKFLIFVLQM